MNDIQIKPSPDGRVIVTLSDIEKIISKEQARLLMKELILSIANPQDPPTPTNSQEMLMVPNTVFAIDSLPNGVSLRFWIPGIGWVMIGVDQNAIQVILNHMTKQLGFNPQGPSSS